VGPTGVASALGSITHDLGSMLEGLDGVEQVLEVSKPYKLASREFHPEDTMVRVPSPGGTILIGGREVVMMAGPCTVESEEQLLAAARAARDQGSNDGEVTDNAVKKLLAHFRTLNADRAPALIVEPAIWFFEPDSHVHKMNFDWLQTSIDNLLQVVNAVESSTAKRSLPNGFVEPFGRDRAIRAFLDIDGCWNGVDGSKFFR